MSINDLARRIDAKALGKVGIPRNCPRCRVKGVTLISADKWKCPKPRCGIEGDLTPNSKGGN